MKTFQDFNIAIPSGGTGNIAALCPQCSPHRKKKNDKCLSVNVSEGVWLCHHCGWAGTLREKESKWLRPEPKAAKPNIEGKALGYLRDVRKISVEAIKRNRVGYGKIWMPQVDAEVMAITFPYYRSGELINVKYRDGAKNFRMVSKAERIVYGIDDLNYDKSSPKEFLICEGEIDKLSWDTAGITNSVSVPDGAPAPDAKNYASKFTYIEGIESVIKNSDRVIIAADDDPAGNALQRELVRRIGAEKCYTVQYPNGCKDANAALVKYGVQKLQSMYEQARPVPLAGISDVDDSWPCINRIYEHGYESGAETRWKNVTKLFTVRTGEMTVVTGIPSHGKSNFLDDLVSGIMLDYGWPVGIFSPENYPLERHVSQWCEKIIRKPFLRGATERINPDELETAKKKMQGNVLWLYPAEDELWSVNELLAKAKILVLRYGIRILIIDPWNEIDHSIPKGSTESQYIGNVLSKIRMFARAHDVHVFLVAHPTKMHKKDDGTYPIPTPYDISGSSNWRNKADNCITVYRNMEDTGIPVEIHIQKIRFREIGKIGVAALRYDIPSGCYSENEINNSMSQSTIPGF